jgi:hypothetical protein
MLNTDLTARDRTVHENDRKLEINTNDPDTGWTRELVMFTWDATAAAEFSRHLDSPEILCIVTDAKWHDDEEGAQSEGINLTRPEVVKVQDFLERVLDPGSVERKFNELQARLREPMIEQKHKPEILGVLCREMAEANRLLKDHPDALRGAQDALRNVACGLAPTLGMSRQAALDAIEPRGGS